MIIYRQKSTLRTNEHRKSSGSRQLQLLRSRTWGFPSLAVLMFLALPNSSVQILAQRQSQASNEVQKWRLPLAEKAEVIQQNILEIHDVEGTYVPSVPLPPDHTVLGVNGDMHTSSWTGCYILGIAFRLGWARKDGTQRDIDASLDIGERILGGIQMLSRISGTPGLLARYVMYGHGVGPEERSFDNARNWWFQGKGEYQHFRYRSHPSHHNYHHMLRGLAHYYYFLTKDNPRPTERERAQIDLTRTLFQELMEFAYKKNNMVLIREDGSISAQQLLVGVAEGRPSTKSLMATNCLKFGYWITSDPWYKDQYDKLVGRFNYRDAGVVPPDRWQGSSTRLRTPDQDDTEHTLASLWLVSQIEEEPQLKAFYRMAIAQIFAGKRDHKRTPFNYFYAAGTGKSEDADLPGALETLRLLPSDGTILPMMNSIRSDIEIVSTRRGRGTTNVLPFNEQPYDNAYTWKGNPFQLDRYLSRQITSLSVSGEDPYVWLLCDEQGRLYRSLDGGETFQVHDQPAGTEVQSVTFAANKNRIAVIATDSGIYWTQGGGYGDSWHRVSGGPAHASASRLMLDVANPNVVWAVTTDGVYRSEDLGMEGVGKVWERVSRLFPASGDSVYGVNPGDNAIIYATSRGRIYRHEIGAEKWTLTPSDAEEYHIVPTFNRIVVSPGDPNDVFFLLSLQVWGRSLPLLLRSTDGAEKSVVTGMQTGRSYIPSDGSGLEGVDLNSITIDPIHHDIVYGASTKGFCRSDDGGRTWTLHNTGLRIPYAYTVLAPKEIPGRIFLSTPAGLHERSDNGTTWNPPILVLNGRGASQTDRGGMGYLVGYWPGRYFGFISEEEVYRSPRDW